MLALDWIRRALGLHLIVTEGSVEVEDGDRVGWALRISWRLCGLAGIKVTGRRNVTSLLRSSGVDNVNNNCQS